MYTMDNKKYQEIKKRLLKINKIIETEFLITKSIRSKIIKDITDKNINEVFKILKGK